MKYANEIIQKTLILSSLTGQEIGFIIGNMLSWLNKGKGYVASGYTGVIKTVCYGIPSTKSLSLYNRMMAELYKGLG